MSNVRSNSTTVTNQNKGIVYLVGIGSAVAAGAYAGVPLTHRNTNSAVVFLPGHDDPQKQNPATDWRSFAKLKNTTLAIHMGMGRLREITTELATGGLAADTPAAIVQWTAHGRQRSVTGTIATIAALAEKNALASPAIVFIGETVAHREPIKWFENLPLFGRRITITRTRDQNSELREKLETLGAEVIELPLITVTPAIDKTALVEILSELGSYDWIVFTSANGVRIFFEQFFKGFDDIRSLGLLRFACIGRATAREIEKHHLKVECMPETATGESLADALIATDSLEHAKVIVVTGNLNRDTLVKKLEEARAIVDRLPLYKTEKTNLANDPAAADFREHGSDAILFTSSSTVDSYIAQSASLRRGENAKQPLHGSIGPHTSGTMREHKIPIAFEAADSSLDSLIEALIAKIGLFGKSRE